MFLRTTLAACLAVAGATAAHSAVVHPTSYDMPNGHAGVFNYFDDKYNGDGNNQISGAALTGGLGDLTDGVIATQNWNADPSGSDTVPYVAWRNIDPILTFYFEGYTDFLSATFHFDDTSGVGGVSPPQSVSVNGILQTVADPAGSTPFAVTIDLTSLAPTNTLTAQINTGTQWVFLSEVTFEAQSVAAVPLPAGGLLMLSALGGLVASRRRKS